MFDQTYRQRSESVTCVITDPDPWIRTHYNGSGSFTFILKMSCLRTEQNTDVKMVPTVNNKKEDPDPDSYK
jgi:hypothetical protein